MEQELATTRAQLQRFQQGEQNGADSHIDEQSISHLEEASPQFSSQQRITQGYSQHGGQADPLSTSGDKTPMQNHTSASASVNMASFPMAFGNPAMTTSKTAPTAFSMETPPATGDFEWDERPHKSRKAQFIDGMASLTGRSSGGYMGAASGAALLRLADDLSAEDPGENEDVATDDAVAPTPPIMALFSLSQLEPFVDQYFQLYHVSYPIVHEATFRAQFMEIVPRPQSAAWQVLLHIIAALGAFTTSEVAPEVDIALFEAAKSRMSFDLLETGNLFLVQALTLLSNYTQKRNRPNSGYNYLGLAKRMAMSLGLHKEFPAWHAKPLMLEMRRRVWWSIYVFDVGAVITFSRPFDMPEDGIEVGLPLNVADSDVTLSTPRLPVETTATTLYTHVRCQSQFHLATAKIYTCLISSSSPSAEKMLAMDNMCLEQWLNDLPVYYREPVLQPVRFQLSHAILKWRWRNFRILMYRSYLMKRFLTKGHHWNMQNISPKPANIEDQVIQRCFDAAAETIHLITNYWKHERQNVMACWYGLYFLFQATLIPVISLRNEPYNALAIGWRDQILLSLSTLADMARLNTAATRCHAVITKLCGAYLAQDMDQWASPVQESPQTQMNALYSFMWPMVDPQFALGQDLTFFEQPPTEYWNQMPP